MRKKWKNHEEKKQKELANGHIGSDAPASFLGTPRNETVRFSLCFIFFGRPNMKYFQILLYICQAATPQGSLDVQKFKFCWWLPVKQPLLEIPKGKWRKTMLLGVDPPFFSTIVLSKTGRFPRVAGGFLESRIPLPPLPRTFSTGARFLRQRHSEEDVRVQGSLVGLVHDHRLATSDSSRGTFP